ncbi:MAG: beta-lactamase family protein [Clostridiales bacterium]|nr:beta-lactamase family protein [Clostridiales bacterium]
MNFEPLHEAMQSLAAKGVPALELIVMRDHETLFHEVMGYSDAARTVKAAPSDRYWLYSCTKPVTAAAAMRAMEEGLFELEQPVAELLPAYRDAYLLKDGARVKPESVMTVRHLMTMSAGLNYNFNRESVRRANERRGGCATTVEIAEALAEDPLDFEPGARFQYSLCHDVLAAVIEKASGMTFRDYVRTRILDPLGMKDTDFDTTDAPRALSALYSWDGEKKRVVLQPSKNNFVLSPAYYSGGAGLCATASDYAAFADAMACGGVGGSGARILKDASIERLRAERLSSFSAIQQFSCTCGPDYGYGLGVRTRSRFDHGVVSALGEFGWDGAAGADILIDPVHRLSMVYVQHVLGWPNMLGAVHLQLRDVLYPILNLA